MDPDLVKRRTALQYIEQMLDIFTCSDLVNCLFYFLTGLPGKTKEEEALIEDDDVDSENYQSRLSISIDNQKLSIDRKIGGLRSSREESPVKG